jgi:hypothetical protein
VAAETTKADIHDETTVAAALLGAYGAVNAVSLYVERGRETFDAVHVEQPVYVEDVAEGIARVLSGAGSVASLDPEQIVHITIEPLRPKMRVALGIDQLGYRLES